MRLHTTPLLENTLSDHIVLTIPAGPEFRRVATLVLGGLGSRVDLPYERMDDLQLAILSALEASNGSPATLEVDVDDERLRLAIGPLALEDGRVAGLDRVLTPLVDEVVHEQREGAAWVVLSVTRAAAPA